MEPDVYVEKGENWWLVWILCLLLSIYGVIRWFPGLYDRVGDVAGSALAYVQKKIEPVSNFSWYMPPPKREAVAGDTATIEAHTNMPPGWGLLSDNGRRFAPFFVQSKVVVVSSKGFGVSRQEAIELAWMLHSQFTNEGTSVWLEVK